MMPRKSVKLDAIPLFPYAETEGIAKYPGGDYLVLGWNGYQGLPVIRYNDSDIAADVIGTCLTSFFYHFKYDELEIDDMRANGKKLFQWLQDNALQRCDLTAEGGEVRNVQCETYIEHVEHLVIGGRDA